MPGEASLAARQYYANPRNQFWTIMGLLFGAGPELPYRQRLARLQLAGIGLWDVLEACERTGSLDQRIVVASERANDVGALCASLSDLRALAFNGQKADRAFRRHILRRWDAATAARVGLIVLPSTSPANARISLPAKLARWKQVPTVGRDEQGS